MERRLAAGLIALALVIVARDVGAQCMQRQVVTTTNDPRAGNDSSSRATATASDSDSVTPGASLSTTKQRPAMSVPDATLGGANGWLLAGWIALAGLQGADLVTTHWGPAPMVERNPVMRVPVAGQVAIKIGATGGMIWGSRMVAKRGQRPRLAAWMVWGANAGMAWVAVHNARVRTQERR